MAVTNAISSIHNSGGVILQIGSGSFLVIILAAPVGVMCGSTFFGGFSWDRRNALHCSKNRKRVQVKMDLVLQQRGLT